MKTWLTLKTAVLMIVAVLALPSTVWGQDLTETIFRVQNLSCGSCLSKIGNELSSHDGAVGMKADLSRGIVIISHRPDLAPETIAAAITAIGYPAEVLEELPLDIAEKRDNTPPIKSARDVSEIVHRTVLSVQNLTCISCVGKIESELRRNYGVLGMKADLAAGIVFVDHENSFPGERIAAIITSLGYTANVNGSGEIQSAKAMYFAGPGDYGSGCGTGGCGSSGCGASSASWKKLYEKYVTKGK